MEKLCRDLDEIFSSSDVVDYKSAVSTLLANGKLADSDWKQYVHFDRKTLKYTRNLVDFGSKKFNALILCWPEGQGSPIHDHSDAGCHVKVLQGTLKETIFNWPDDAKEEEMIASNPSKEYTVGQVTYIDDSVGLHRMENPSHVEGTVTLHIYYPPYMTCHKFDDGTGHKTQVKMSFTSVNGELCQ